MSTSRLVRLDQVEPAALDWLWFPFLARGHVSLLEGPPACGKSLLAVDLAARLSRGGPMPDGRCFGRRLRTLFLNAEDRPATALRPRLAAAGAHLAAVFAFGAAGSEDGRVDLVGDRYEIDDAIVEAGADLVVIDPLSAFFPTGVRGYTEQSLQAILRPLAELAAGHNVAVLLVRRTDPAGRRDGPARVASQGHVATALELRRDGEEPGRLAVALTKSTIGPAVPPVGCRLVEGVGGPRLDWLSGAELAERPPPDEPDRPGPLDAAKAWLKAFLSRGPVASKAVYAAGAAAGHSQRTLERAKAALRFAAEAEVTAAGREWVWLDPAVPYPLAEEAAPGARVALAALAALAVDTPADDAGRGRGPPDAVG